jgi:two-component system, OmpR family, sensor histidine kinase KdpD
MVDKIPDIQEILAKAKTEEPNRGKLKIFFGAMAGVGKTYSMLEAARVRKKEGDEVVCGYVETHKRAETDALLEGLEILPRKKIIYKGIELGEFDVDGALKRHPSLILVDELAHTNAPDCRNLKRWQDVEELLEAGIDVYTTLNVQHCESINDVVAQITGVTVRETVPDTFVEKADDIELVDLPPEDLLQRLKEGKVYLGDQAERAIQNFFQIGNLIALRQLALQYTSRLVDAKMRTYKQTYSISKVWNVRDRFLVSISTSPRAMNLIRAGKRIASGLGVEWVVAYVETPSYAYNKAGKARVTEMMRFAEKLGAETVVLPGQDTAETLISYARSNNITKIIAGKPGKPRWHELLFGSTINNLARKCGEIDLYLISGDTHEQPVKAGIHPPKPFPWLGLLLAIAMIAFFTAAGKLVFQYVAPENMGMLYLLGVVVIAYRYGLRVSIITAVLSVLAYDYFFVLPLYTFEVADIDRDLATFTIIFIISLLISLLTARLKQQTMMMRLRENRTEALYHLTRELAKSSNPYELLQIASFNMQKFFKCSTAIFYADKGNRLVPYLDDSNGAAKLDHEKAVAEWAYAHNTIAGKDTETLPSSRGVYVPLIGVEKTVGVMGLFPPENKQFTDPEQLHMLEMFASQTALAVEGAQLAETAVKTEYDIENERFRNMLLSTFSLDLSAPLKTISEATSELLKTENIDDRQRRETLINKIQHETERLNNLSKEIIDIIKSKDELG